MLTKACTSLVLFGAGDVLAQVHRLPSALQSSVLLIKQVVDQGSALKVNSYDFGRTARAGIFGFALLGPLSHCHYTFMHWLFNTRLKLPNTLATSVAKMFLEQFGARGLLLTCC